jgi:hypothetical protein
MFREFRQHRHGVKQAFYKPILEHLRVSGSNSSPTQIE